MEPTNRLQFMPISFFSMVMGLAGLTIAWEKVSSLHHLDPGIFQILLIVTSSVFGILTVLYLLKAMLYRQAVIEEWTHPVKISFVPTVSISLLLLSIAFLPISRDTALVLWTAGTALHLAITLMVVNSWLHHEKYRIEHLSPAWFIPAVGNVVIPIAGVTLGHAELSWFFFSVGMVFWLVLMVIVFNRVIFHAPLPAKLLPTLFILIAPPSVGFLAYLKLVGSVDAFAQVLFNFALFLTLLLFSQLPRFARIPFFISWWAYSFPLAAMSIASIEMGERSGQAFYSGIGLLLLGILSLLILVLTARTLAAARRHQICLAE